MHRKEEILLLAFLLGALCSSQAAPAPLKLGSAAPPISRCAISMETASI
jgi:hypothetical protein